MRLQNHSIHCPYCGHHQYVELDPSGGDQDYIEDCQGCCNPMHLRLSIDESNHRIALLIDADDEQYY